jgi:DNA polymerase I-like protein with 3'-5' exonuclease and polymerase domains
MSSISSFFQDAQSCHPDPKPWMQQKKFTLIRDMDHLRQELARASAADVMALDLETQGLDNRIDENGRTFHQIVGYCFAYNCDEGFYVPVRHVSRDGNMVAANLPYLEVDAAFRDFVATHRVVYHNSGFDQEFLYGSSAHVPDPPSSLFEDTLILDYLKDSTSKKHGLKALSKEYLGLEMHELKEFFPKKEKGRSFAELDPTQEAVLQYAGADAICTYMLYQHLKEYGDEQKATYKVEKALVPALRWTERNRMKVDLPYVSRLQSEALQMIEDTQDEIYASLAQALNKHELDVRKAYDINSPTQLGHAFEALQQVDRAFGALELEKTENSGQIKTDNASLEKILAEHGDRFPFLALVQKMRGLQKVEGTYIRPIKENTRKEDSTIRFSFQANRVDTGRFAASKGVPDQGYSGINVQSIPGTYSYAKFYTRKVHSRPKGEGEGALEENLQKALDKGFLRLIYDGHFMQDLRTGDELCVRSTCDGCPFASECKRDEPVKGMFYSIENAVRPAIVAREGYVLCALDYSGLELRAVASICEEPRWLAEFYRCSSCDHEFTPPKKIGRNKWEIVETPPAICPTCGEDTIGDLHTLTTKIIYGDDVVNLPPSEFKKKRQNGKGANFSIVYGGGGGAIARATGVDSKEGWEIRNKVLNGLPTFKRWMDNTIHHAHQNLEVETAIGRKIRLWDINSEESWLRAKQERNAINSIVQGTATGDLIKYAMAKVHSAVKDRKWEDVCRMCLTIHDELVFEIRQDMLDEVLPVIDDCMTEFAHRVKWPIPLVTDVEFNTDWSPNYNWTLMHSIHPKTKIAAEPTPSFLLDKITMSPGMWYKADDGTQMVWTGEEYVPYEEFNADEVEMPEESPEPVSLSLATEEAPEATESVDKVPVVPTLPFYDYTATTALSGRESVASYMTRLRRVGEACKVMAKLGIAKPTHTLRVYTIQHDELTDPEKIVEVDPKVFRALAFYEGL